MENNKTNNIKVTGVTNVTEETQKPRTQGFTQKTLKAWTDQNTRIKQDNLLTEEECLVNFLFYSFPSVSFTLAYSEVFLVRINMMKIK